MVRKKQNTIYRRLLVTKNKQKKGIYILKITGLLPIPGGNFRHISSDLSQGLEWISQEM